MSSDDPMDDPRLTAHAMGEAAGPLTPEEQAEVDAIRATAETLKAGFAATPMPTLDHAHREAILQGLSPEPAQPGRGTVPGSVLKLSEYSGLGALAATLLLVIGFGIAGAAGGGLGSSAGNSNLYVATFSAPNYRGNTTADFDTADSTFESKTKEAFAAWKPSGGANGHDSSMKALGAIDNEGTGVPSNGSGKPSSGAFFNEFDGDYKGRTEHLLDSSPRGPTKSPGNEAVAAMENSINTTVADLRRRLSDAEKMKAKDPEGARERIAALTAERRFLKGELDKASGTVKVLKDAKAGSAPSGNGVSLQWSGVPVGGIANQGDKGLGVFDVKDITNGIENFPADDENMELVIDQEGNVRDPRFRQLTDKDGAVAGEASSTESYLAILENAWIRPVGEAALSTFSIDVDTAGYSIVRRCLVEQNRLPPPGALRVEELVNYFPYAYDGPVSADPFAVHVDAAACPWAPGHRLVRIALKGREFEEAQRPAANLVFLLDVSGSMAQPNKLPLVKKSIEMLSERLTARDRVAMVVYAGNSGLVLPSTPAGDHAAIVSALDHLEAGGSTNGGAGIELAYKVAAENFVSGGINRVVLATDGDFNVGVSDPSSLVKMVEEKAKTGVFLTALGYGMDNLKDSTLEQLADRGNGNYGYIDNLGEARKVLVEQGMSTLHCIAKDVKIQVEFNPAKVAGYRLLGYENRMLAAQDFADDTKDAGEIGAGHTVTALYEVVPAGVEVPGAPVDELRYQRPGSFSGNAETLVVKLRWKEPEGAVSTPREFPFVDAGLSFESASADFRFAAGVAAFGMVLRDSKQAGSANLDLVREIAAGAVGADAGGYRAEFVTLVEKARALKK